MVLFFPPQAQLKAQEGGKVLNIPPNVPGVDGVFTSILATLIAFEKYSIRSALLE